MQKVNYEKFEHSHRIFLSDFGGDGRIFLLAAPNARLPGMRVIPAIMSAARTRSLMSFVKATSAISPTFIRRTTGKGRIVSLSVSRRPALVTDTIGTAETARTSPLVSWSTSRRSILVTSTR